jgi:DNA-binding transcriptional MerR regulator
MSRVLLTVGGVARSVGVSEWTVRRYARENLIEHSTDSAGRRLFDASVLPIVRALYAKRIASRGRGTRD